MSINKNLINNINTYFMSYEEDDAFEEDPSEEERERKSIGRDPTGPRGTGKRGGHGGRRRGAGRPTGRSRGPRFRIHARCIALTYSKCGDRIITRDQLGNHLLSLGHPVECAIVAQEHHKDGSIHYHAFVQYHAQHNFTRCDTWDFQGVHCQAQGCRGPAGWIKYLRKEDRTPWTFGCLPGEERAYISLAKEGKVQEAVYQFSVTHPRDFVLHKPTVEANLAKLARVQKPAKFSLSNFPYRPFNDWNRRTTLILSGPSDIGKTELAKAYLQGNFLLCRTLDRLKDLDQETYPGQGIILDDFNLDGWSREEIIHLFDCENDTTIKCRYSDATIPEGTARIMTTNKSWVELFGHLPTLTGIERRVTFTLLDGDLYDRGIQSPVLHPINPPSNEGDLIDLSLGD